jgi:hypothetical protein
MLEYVALFLVFFVAIVIFYGIIVVHDIPYEIAEKRNHPHQDAIHVAGWISLFTLGAIWPFLWIWATLYKPGFGWGMTGHTTDGKASLSNNELEASIVELKNEISDLRNQIVKEES